MNYRKLGAIVVAGGAAVFVVNILGNEVAGDQPQEKKPAPVEVVAPKPEPEPPVKEVVEIAPPEPKLSQAEIARQEREAALERRKLRLRADDFMRVRSADHASILEVSFVKGSSGEYIAQLKPVSSRIHIEHNGQMDSSLVFSTEDDKAAAEKIIHENGIIATSLKEEAISRRMTCGVNKCIGSVDAFPEIARRFLVQPKEATDEKS